MMLSVTHAAENYLFTELSTETGERETDSNEGRRELGLST